MVIILYRDQNQLNKIPMRGKRLQKQYFADRARSKSCSDNNSTLRLLLEKLYPTSIICKYFSYALNQKSH